MKRPAPGSRDPRRAVGLGPGPVRDVPIVIAATTPGSLVRVGGMPLVVRSVLALREAGYRHVTVFAGDLGDRVREALAGTPVYHAMDLAAVSRVGTTAEGWSVLVLAGDVLFDPRVLTPLVAADGPHTIRPGVRRASDTATHVLRCPLPMLPGLLAQLQDHGALGLAIRSLDGAAGQAVVLDPGLYEPLGAAPSPAALTRALLDDLGARTAATDGYLAAALDRHLSRAITRVVLPWPVSPNQITVVGMAIGLLGAGGLATVSYGSRVAGVMALLVSSILDGVDGEVARARFQQSPRGARLDLAGDYLTHLGTFVGLGVGLTRQGLPAPGRWAALALVLGVGAAMVVMHTFVVRPALMGSGDLHGKLPHREAREARMAAVIERLAGRDYTYLLLVLALVGHLEWFLYGAAIGSWAFAVGLFLLRTRPGSVRDGSRVTRLVATGARDRSTPD